MSLNKQTLTLSGEASRTARKEMSGPIAPIDYFDNRQREVLSQHAREGSIDSIVLDGVTYVSYFDVYGRVLSDFFESETDCPAAWDATYSTSWSPLRRFKTRWAKPRGFKEAVRADFFSRISLGREATLVANEKGEPRWALAAYPRHVAGQAAELFLTLNGEEGFTERFRQEQHFEDEVCRVDALSSFSDYEAQWFRIFAAKGFIRLCRIQGAEHIATGELMYYDLFAAKIVEDELDINFELESGADGTVYVMHDGTFSHGGPWRVPTTLHIKQDVSTDR